jgi:hypothetical protein
LTAGHFEMRRKQSNITGKHQETTKNAKEIIALSLGVHSSCKI